MFEAVTFNAAAQRTILIDGFLFTESRLREALKWIEAQPTHGWKPGDVFVYHSIGSKHDKSIFKILSLEGQNAASVAQLWHGYKNQVGEQRSFVWFLPDSYMVKLAEVV